MSPPSTATATTDTSSSRGSSSSDLCALSCKEPEDLQPQKSGTSNTTLSPSLASPRRAIWKRNPFVTTNHHDAPLKPQLSTSSTLSITSSSSLSSRSWDDDATVLADNRRGNNHGKDDRDMAKWRLEKLEEAQHCLDAAQQVMSYMPPPSREDRRRARHAEFRPILLHIERGLEAVETFQAMKSGDGHVENRGKPVNRVPKKNIPKETVSLTLKLKVLQAEVYGRMGLYAKSLACYEQVVGHVEDLSICKDNADKKPLEEEEPEYDDKDLPTAADVANLYYTCGRLSKSLGARTKTLHYYRAELATVKAWLGPDHLAVARVYQALAHLYQNELANAHAAQDCLQEALSVERAVLARLEEEMQTCAYCNGREVPGSGNFYQVEYQEHEHTVGEASGDSEDGSSGSSSSEPCTSTFHHETPLDCGHAEQYREAAYEYEETKRQLGRILFHQGEIDQALRVSMGVYTPCCKRHN